MNLLKRVFRNQAGQDLMEYGLLAALISIVAILALQTLGPLIASFYVAVRDTLPAAP
jgi:Flp pilus assembly pilin Flp